MKRLLDHQAQSRKTMPFSLLDSVGGLLLFKFTGTVFQKFVTIVNCILRKAFNSSLGKYKMIQVRNLSK